MSTVTFNSNLTGTTSGGATISSASTSKSFTASAATLDIMTQIVQVAANGTTATTVDVGTVDLTKAHSIRFRNTSTETNFIVVVIGTFGGTDRIMGLMRAGCTFGPEEKPGSGFTLASPNPTASAGATAYKLSAYKNDASGAAPSSPILVEVQVVQTGSVSSGADWIA